MTDVGTAWVSTTPIAHRGLHDGLHKPNTLGALARATAAGYAVEFDVVLSADGTPFVSHDYRFRTRSGKRAYLLRSSASEIACGRSLSTGEEIPTLRDGLRAVAGLAPAYVDIKPMPNARKAAAMVADTVDLYSGPLAVLSFDPRVLLWFRRNRRRILRGQSAGAYHMSRVVTMLQYPAYSMPLNWLTKPDFIAFDMTLMPSRAVSAWIRCLDAKLIVWGVRTDADAARARSFGANMMFDDIRPELPDR